jgi:hypothetical protein
MFPTVAKVDSFEIIRVTGIGWTVFPTSMRLKAAKKHFNRVKESGELPSLRHYHARISVIEEYRLFRTKYIYTVEPLNY